MEIAAVFIPFVMFLVTMCFNKDSGHKAAQVLTSGGMIISAILSVLLFNTVIFGNQTIVVYLAEWISVGDFHANWSLRFDALSVVMMCVVTIVSACVHVYSIGYMSHDECRGRFMSYLSLFTFAMLMLVTSDNLIQLFFGWEGVGLASYLLIGFWNKKPSANSAAIKAFVTNRVGDLGLALGIFATFMVFGTVEFNDIFNAAPDFTAHSFSFFGHEVHSLTMIGLLLFIGAMGKSAQLGLHVWLPDAMEGPTPVSALIHAATMVTAGVFLVARFSPLYEYAPDALMFICVIGALTAFVAATIALTQNDIKRVIAYSTMSQLGYMFFALGVSAYEAAIFHLMTHAFFKALLFLGAGSVIHAMSDEQDMRKMGGIWRHIPVTYVLMWVGSLALAGMPFFAGYYSKDIILEAAWADETWFGTLAYTLGIAAAFMTAFYSWRLIIMTFHGQPRADEKVMAHIHESPRVMLMPLIVLATGAVFAGSFFYGGFVGSAHHGAHAEMEFIPAGQDPHSNLAEVHVSIWNKERFWGSSIKTLQANDTVEAAHNVPKLIKKLPIVAGGLGILFAFAVYQWFAGSAGRIQRLFGPLYTLFHRKWFFDELYEATILKLVKSLGRFFSNICDKKIIDRCGPDGIASAARVIAIGVSRAQTGYFYHYIFVMIIGLIGLITWFLYKAGVLL
jgi:NADH-quinone oxidoreductase subunit L